MGVAFITKHTRFWMHKCLPNEMLPIYDSTFSFYVMRKGRNAQLKDLLAYWDAMIHKSSTEGVSLTALERAIFKYYRPGNPSKNTTFTVSNIYAAVRGLSDGIYAIDSDNRHIRQFKTDQLSEASELMESIKDNIAGQLWG